MRALEIVFRILWSVALGGLIYGSTIWLLRVELSGDIERMEPGKAWLLRGLAWINAVVILVIGGMDGRLPEENRLVIQGAQEILCSLLAGGLLAAACMDAVHSYVYNYVWWWCLPWTGILLGLPVLEAYMEDGVCRILTGLAYSRWQRWYCLYSCSRYCLPECTEGLTAMHFLHVRWLAVPGRGICCGFWSICYRR